MAAELKDTLRVSSALIPGSGGLFRITAEGRVVYDLADFELDGRELRERFRFYTDRFPVRLES